MYKHSDALRHFKKVDPILHRAAKDLRAAPSEISEKRGTATLFAALASTIVSQQLAVRAAETIWQRVKKACGGKVTPETVSTASEEDLRGAGLSGSKLKTLKALSRAVLTKELSLTSLRTIPEEEAVKNLTSIWGIGPWTAEMFLMFALGRSDVFSVCDLALLRSIETLYGLPKNSPRDAYLEIAKKWSPYRTHASLVLWKMRDPG
jgi:DNA-3-methyladenine glycosylase II